MMQHVFQRTIMATAGLLSMTAWVGSAVAHPGHGVTPAKSVVHHWVEMEHGALLQLGTLAVLFVALAGLWMLVGARSRGGRPALVRFSRRR